MLGVDQRNLKPEPQSNNLRKKPRAVRMSDVEINHGKREK